MDATSFCLLSLLPSRTSLLHLAVVFSLLHRETLGQSSQEFYGTLIGNFKNYAHGISGSVYAVDEDTVVIKGFSYDGSAPDAYFWIGDDVQPSPRGSIVPYPQSYSGEEPPILGSFEKEDILLHFPKGMKLTDIKWLSVWCRRFTVNFGDVRVPRNLRIPKKEVLTEFSRLAHGLRSGNVTVLDERTFYIPNLHYDGAGPDAFFLVGTGPSPNPNGLKVPNEQGSLKPLRGYQGVDIEIQLPQGRSVHEFDWLSVYCITYKHDFGHVRIPKNLYVPPALGQTKITTRGQEPESLTNCIEPIPGKLQIRWSLKNDEFTVKMTGKIEDEQYMAFGISGDLRTTKMVGGDVAVAFYDRASDRLRVVDYYMTDKSQVIHKSWRLFIRDGDVGMTYLGLVQCDGRRGVCPDERLGGKDDVEYVEGERRNGIASVTYRRAARTNDNRQDIPLSPSARIPIIAAIGNLNSRNEANYHFSERTGLGSDFTVDLGGENQNQCAVSLSQSQTSGNGDERGRSLEPWKPQIIIGQNRFKAQIGPTGGKRGYSAITGHNSWGIAWWINEKLIPEIYVERGQTYEFEVEGGNDSTSPAKYHPLYITDSSEGGYGQKSVSDQAKEKVYAGIAFDQQGFPYPSAMGRLCEWQHKTTDKSESSETLEEYKKTLKLDCQAGRSGQLIWTVPLDAPKILYYQCYTHTNLGWKIHVVDPGFRLRRGELNAATQSIIIPPLLLLLVFPAILLR
ncbi:unnamed protein product [Darwinula stevensoni]|uniref:Protein Skeletor n=1 Tax=Darwinula stevensoni TaxID=69355 RepID=A0A7R8X302_9CRUS|nr:unnamed protein product [Darwinula stevensoni]CAG0884477.1 unnamed protein product [Darwinula stevensoni]